MSIDEVAMCSNCGELIFADGKRKVCMTCRPVVDAKLRARNPHHHSPSSQKAMKAVVATAQGNPLTVCHLCLSKTPPPKLDGKWSADHERPGDVRSRLLPAHLGCNSSRGNGTVQAFRQALVRRIPDWFDNVPSA